jgi:hypothetical protein
MPVLSTRNSTTTSIEHRGRLVDTAEPAQRSTQALPGPSHTTGPSASTAMATTATTTEGSRAASIDPARQTDARRAALAGDARQQLRQHGLAAAAPTSMRSPHLPAGYDSLQALTRALPTLDARFSPDTAEGRAALTLAVAIGGTEVYGRGATATDFFTRRGGTGNRMLGFAQMNLAFHRRSTSTPERYARTVADMLTGARRMPNSDPASNHAAALADAVADGAVRTGDDLRQFMDQRGFGGSNWQGIDDGWSRVPGLSDALVGYLRRGDEP